MSDPLVSVITVNFNGEQYLEGLLSSLRRQTYPNMELLVVDNGSTDGSERLVRHRFPEVRWIAAGGNLGFTGGNNLGIRESRGDYVALVNNDTVADPYWLQSLVAFAREDSTIGGVTSKIVFARPFVPVELIVPSLTQGEHTGRGVFLTARSGFEECSYRKRIYSSGFGGEETVQGESGRWTEGRAKVFLPVESKIRQDNLRLRFWGGHDSVTRRLLVLVAGREVAQLEMSAGWSDHRVELSGELLRTGSYEIINNVGTVLRENGETADRGIYQPDLGQFDQPAEVSAVCGCSMLVPRAVLEEVGLFDERLFMYFEDTELSWRIRKAGYRLWYQPASLVRHFHASTSVEWSPLFIFLVSRNRILMLMRHGRLRHVLRAYAQEVGRWFRALWIHRSLLAQEVRTRTRVQLSLLRWGPIYLFQRESFLG